MRRKSSPPETPSERLVRDIRRATRNMLLATFRNVLKVAQDDGLIDVVPATPVGRRDRIGSSAQSVAQSPNRPWSALHDAEVQKDVRGSA